MMPTIPSLEKICAAFGITLSQLFAGDEDAVVLTPVQRKLPDRRFCLDEGQQTAILQLIDRM